MAVQLSKVADGPEETDEEIENQLLNGDTSKPSTPVESTPPGTIAASAPAADGVDTVGLRVQQIFGKRPAIDKIVPESSPKVANVDTGDSDTNDKTNVTNIDAAETPDKETIGGNQIMGDEIPKPPQANTIVVAPPSVPPVETPKDVPMEAPGEVKDVPMEQNDAGPDDAEAEDDGDDGDGDEWVEQDDQPQAFPEMGFPIQVPSYPRQPDFDYRYRTFNSTPQGRRVDHVNSIVLRKCVRDRHTGRIPQEEYEAREDAEMALSLG